VRLPATEAPAPSPSSSPAAFLNLDGAFIAFVKETSTTGRFYAYDGKLGLAAGGGVWKPLGSPVAIAATTSLPATYTEITVRADYVRHKYDVWLNGSLSAVNLGFHNASLSSPASLILYGRQTGVSFYDDLYISPVAPAFIPFSTANDGIPDTWKQQHNIPLADASLRNQIDSTGLSLIEKFFYGLSPDGTGLADLLGTTELPRGFFREIWYSISGLQVSQFTAATHRFRTSADAISLTTGAETPQNVANQYGQRLRGYITIPQTGDYRFYLTADDRAELYIAANGTKWNKTLAAQVATSHAGTNEWTNRAEQRSVVYSFSAGQKVYIEILHKEDDGEDYARLGWTTPDSATVSPVPADLLTAYTYDPNDQDDDGLPDDWETLYNLSPADNGTANILNGPDGINNTLGLPNYICAAAGVSPFSPPANIPYNGVFSREVWTNISGATTAALKTSPSFLNAAAINAFVSPAGPDAPTTIANNSGERWRGYITVSVTGNYSFGVHSGGAAELFISSDNSLKNKRPVALVREATSSYEFRFSEQRSVPVALQAGQTYYIEVLFKQGTGNALFQLTWDTFLTNNYVPLPPENISSYAPDNAHDRAGFSLDWLTQNNLSPNSLLPSAYSAAAPSSPSASAYFDNWTSYRLGVSPTATGAALNTLFNAPSLTPHQGLTHEIWFNTSGPLSENINKFLTAPDRREIVLGGDDFPAQLADDYISRTRGYIVAPVTGDYRFVLNTDDEAELFLSPSSEIAAAVRILSAPCTDWNFWGEPSQKSVLVTLQAGQKYYFEVRYREGGGDDFLRVAWQLPNTTETVLIPASATRPFAPSSADPHGFGYPESWFANAGFSTLTLEQRAPWADPFASGRSNAANYTLGLNPLGVAGSGPFTNIYGTLELPGRLLLETWTNIEGGSPFALRRFTNDFRNTPASVAFSHGADRETNDVENYGQRLRGYITIPQTGEYNFYISGDENAELYISTTGVKWGKVRAAFTTGNVGFRQWTGQTSQKSATFSLTAGQKLYIEIQHKKGGGGGSFSLAWTSPNNTAVATVPASVLSSFVLDANDADDDDLPDSWETQHGLSTSDNGNTDPLNGKHGVRNNIGLQNYQCAALNIAPNAPTLSSHWGVTEISGSLLREHWENILGDDVSALVNSPAFISANAQKSFLSTTGVTAASTNSGERWRGWITAPYTGNYSFGIHANNTAEFYLSSDANPLNKRQIATVSGATDSLQFLYPEQRTLNVAALVAGQRYYIEVLFKKGTSGATLRQLSWTTPVDGDSQYVPEELLTAWSKGTTFDSSGLSLAWLAQNNLTPDSLSPNAKATGGYLPYWAAYKLNTTPTAASSLQNPVAGGWTYDLWFDATGETLTDNQNKFLTTPDKRDVVTGGDRFPQQLGDSFVARVRGYIVAPTTGYYRFALNSDDEAEFYLSTDAQIVNAKKLIEAPCTELNQWTTAAQQSSPVYLQAGQRYFVEIRHHEAGGDDFLRVAWQTPGNGYLDFIPASAMQAFIPDASDPYGLGYPQSWLDSTGLSALSLAEQMPWADANADGLTNLEKYTLGLNPLSADTDGDGISDYEEIKQVGSNPLATDFDGTATPIATLNGSAYNAAESVGNWQISGTSVHAADVRGALLYNVEISSAGIYRLVVTGGQHLSTSTEKILSIDLYANNIYVGRVRLNTGSTGVSPASAAVWLPYLPAGTHTLKLVWLNGVTGSSLRIDNLLVEQRGGTWLAARQANLSFVDPAPIATYTSPYCLEGKSPDAPSTNISGAFIPDTTATDPYSVFIRQKFFSNANENANTNSGTNGTTTNAVTLAGKPALRGYFYADIPLSPAAANALTINDTAANTQHTKVVTWQPYNIAEHHTATIHVRKGDALLLQSAATITITPPSGVGTATTLPVPPPPATGTPFTFENSGTHQLTSAGSAVTVIVVAATLSPAPTTILSQRRNWTPLLLDPAAELLNDDGLLLAEGPALQGKRTFSLQPNTPTPQNIVARLYETGPILDVVEADILQNNTSTVATWQIIEVFSDGTVMWKATLNFGGNISENFRAKLTMYKAGSVFDDGSTVRWVTAADFGENGTYTYYMLLPPGVDGSSCHSALYYDGETLISEQL
jgi:hypothetical protein